MADDGPELRSDDFQRRILLVVTGLTPQILTETVYALAKRPEDAWIPTEVHLATTAEGARRAELTLLRREPGWFARLCDDLGLGDIHFDENCLHVVNAGGTALDDIRSEDDNKAAANFITELIAAMTRDDRASLHVSIAGGRKTMGFYAGYALSLYGRDQDSLSHVLVSAPFESHPEFYYPGCSKVPIYSSDRTHKPLDTTKAVVTLAEIPFVRMREDLPYGLLDGSASFGEAVKAAQAPQEEPAVIVESAARTLDCGGTRVELQPSHWAFYAWIAERCQQGLAGVERSAPQHLEDLLDWYRIALDELSERPDNARKALSENPEVYLQERKSRVNATLIQRLGRRHAEPYLIVSRGRRPDTRYEINLEPEQISFSGPARERLSTTASGTELPLEEKRG